MLTPQHLRAGRQQGQVLVLFALGLVAMMALLALVIDVGNIFIHRRVAYTAADTASLAGARALSQQAPAGSSVGQEVARAVCMYGRSNNFGGVTTDVSLADYVGTNGAALGTSYVGTGAAPSCPTPTASVCTVPPSSTCGTIASSPIPNAAAGVRVRTAQTFNTYFAGIIGVPTFTVEAEAVAQVGLLSTYSSSSPFIACGVNMALASGQPNAPSGQPWTDYTVGANAVTKLVTSSGGGWTVRSDLYTATPPGPVSSGVTPPPAAGQKPSGPAYVLHGTVNNGRCGASNNWKGLSCVNIASCPVPPNPSNSEMVLNLPVSSPPYYQLANGENGNNIGLAANTVGPNGCGGGDVTRCVSIVPMASGGDTGDNMQAVAWGAFWLDDCYIPGGGTEQTCGWFIGNYTATSGTTTNTWTYGAGNAGGVVVIKLVA
jgi:Flp pilus assembly protein TadG